MPSNDNISNSHSSYGPKSRRSSSITKPSISLSWEHINVYSKKLNKCCNKKFDDVKTNGDNNAAENSFDMQFKKYNNRHQILRDGLNLIKLILIFNHFLFFIY